MLYRGIKTKIDLGEQFSFGWIADFNQNGINEIFVHRKEVFGSSFFSIEFIDNRFVEIPITNRGDILKSVDWEQSKIVVETNPFRSLVWILKIPDLNILQNISGVKKSIVMFFYQINNISKDVIMKKNN